jgi:hypothetical protein
MYQQPQLEDFFVAISAAASVAQHQILDLAEAELVMLV